MPKIDAAPLDPLIIEEIKKREEERRRKEEQPQIDIPGDIPEHDPEKKKKWEEEERRKEENPRGEEKIDLV